MLTQSNSPHAHARRGFTLIEMIVAIAIMAILVGAAVPVTSKVMTYHARKATREELQGLSDASAQFFRDTKRLPKSIEELLVKTADKGWAGPYLPGVVTDQITQLTGYQVDAWSRPYELAVKGDVLTIVSAGEDAGFGDSQDLDIELNVTWIRREETLDTLKVINQAIVLYNGQYQSTAPLSTKWSSALDQLVSKGFLPQSTGYEVDGWGKSFVADPAGKSPVVRVTSPMLDAQSVSISDGKDDKDTIKPGKPSKDCDDDKDKGKGNDGAKDSPDDKDQGKGNDGKSKGKS